MRIQIVEDDRALSDGIRLALQEAGLTFTQSASLLQARKDFSNEVADIVILDINLPDGSGYDYLRWVKEKSEALVLILTANDMETDEVMGLTLGADDYMAKPFSLAVLRARITLFRKRITDRRADAGSDRPDARSGDAGGTALRNDAATAGTGGGHPVFGGTAPENIVFEEDSFRFDFDRLEYFKNGREISLSVNEQKLLRLFVENPGRLLTRNLLLDRLWGDSGEYVDENALSVTVNRLRRKLENKKDGASYIQTVYGQGYIWKKKTEKSENKQEKQMKSHCHADSNDRRVSHV